MTDTIDYGNLMHRAMRGLVTGVLTEVGANGLPGEHHFFVTYVTTHPQIRMPVWLKERYPEEITIVIQHWFEDLKVDDEGFGITLNFGDEAVPLYIPFDAVTTFVDPSVEFGLRFDGYDSKKEESGAAGTNPARIEKSDAPEAEIVSLDSFRKT